MGKDTIIGNVLVVMALISTMFVIGCMSNDQSNNTTVCVDQVIPLNVTELEEQAKAEGKDYYTIDLSKIKVVRICTTTSKGKSGFDRWIESIFK